MSQKNSEGKKRLGRGLAALLGETGKPGDPAGVNVLQIPIEFLKSSPYNPRQNFPEHELEELAESIKHRGIIQPIIVRQIDGVSDAYEIIAGERRWRAAQRAGLHLAPVIVVKANEKEALELAIIENVQRSDLNALEEATGFARLATEHRYSHAEIASAVGKSRSHIANILRLLGLPEPVKQMLASGAITAGHARALLSVENPEAVAEKIVGEGMSVRDVENLARSEPKPARGQSPHEQPDPNLVDLERRLSTTLGVGFKIRSAGGGYAMSVKLQSADQLNNICDLLLYTRA